MNHKNRILEKLLDKYEERKNGSNRRVLLQCSKRESGAPDIESESYGKMSIGKKQKNK
mgnify:CR=1 FL=1